jgi:hypothetical protein
MCSGARLWHTRQVLSSRVRVFGLSIACVLCGSSLAHAQLVESVLDSEEAKEEGVPFRGSTFGFLQTLSSDTLSRSEYLSYNPTYAWGFSLDLMWHFNRVLQVRLNQEMSVELTDSDLDTGKQQVLLSDTFGTLDARVIQQKVSPEFEWTLHTSGSLSAPTSLASQAATMVLGTRLGVAGGFTFPKVLSGLGTNLTLSYMHRFLTSNVPQADVAYPCSAGSASLAMCSQTGAGSNSRNIISLAAGAELAMTDKWGLSLNFSHAWKRAANLADSSFTTDDGETIELPDDSVTHWRNSTTLEVSVGYLVVPWLGLGLSLTNTFKDRGPDSELRAPFEMVDTYFGLNASLRLDEVYLAASGKKGSSVDE